MGDNAGQINRCFNPGVAATNDRNAFALEQWSIAMRAVGDTLAAIFLLTRYIHFAPARTGGENDCFALDRGTIFEFQLDQLTRNQLCGALQVHHINIVILDVLFKPHDQFRTIRGLD